MTRSIAESNITKERLIGFGTDYPHISVRNVQEDFIQSFQNRNIVHSLVIIEWTRGSRQKREKMPKPICIFTYLDEDGETFAYGLGWFAQFGLETEDAVAAVYENRGAWQNVTLKPLTGGIERDIRRAARMPDPEGIRGFVIDETELPASRAACAVASWTFTDAAGVPVEVSKDGYNSLPIHVMQVLETLLYARLYGSIDPFFTTYWNSKRAASEVKPA